MNYIVHPEISLKGTVDIPGDKSISHRVLILGALAEGETEVQNLLKSEDVFSTLAALRQLGCQIRESGTSFFIQGTGLKGLQQPTSSLDCGNSGTTMRLLLGVLAGQNFSCQLTGDASLCKRPMKRVTEPLTHMGARFDLTEDNYPPIEVHGAPSLKALFYELPVASAQVKSALLLAGLFADGETTLSGKIQSRDHTERLLRYMGVSVSETDSTITLTGGQTLAPKRLSVPGDPSTAAFWVAAASIVPASNIELNNILLNPSRIGFFKILQRMGARLKTKTQEEAPEPIGRITAQTSPLHGTDILPEEISSLIDEVPLIAIVACRAKGKTQVSGAGELRVKESDRIHAIVQNLIALGVEVEETADGFIIEGPQAIGPGVVESYQDHRIAMAFSIAALVATGPVEIKDSEVVRVSYPRFFEDLKQLTKSITS